ncbi:DUF4743 domain-containing protein [Hwanghaeella grinnelliae]|uniref:DUF4743 domain-containing protein n=1 Tax=Hwanghaeella grinnelliae TaxID=2500179 RepID=A0A3S2Z7S8_9PROT|nr:DUF4743 domain-containing protein [Hwanghaeella grinnelliae]RVU36641.1 DUF4743 domain-containing protein [Hwanghaeella grinnelliae]
MSFLDHIRACNNGDLSVQTRFCVAGENIGWVGPEIAETLLMQFDCFSREADAIVLTGAANTVEERSALMADVAAELSRLGVVDGLRDELFPAMRNWGEEPRFLIDRVAVPPFGLRAWGIHLNGYVRKADGLHLWIGRRASGKSTYPDLLDNTVAGGQPFNLTLRENLIKECGEEASITPAMAAQAVPVGCITYVREEKGRIKPDVMFCYDLEMPENFTPVNTDGELAGFYLLPAGEVMEIIRTTEEFKFNCNLVLIDFFIRHGLLTPDDEPDYTELCEGMRKGHAAS